MPWEAWVTLAVIAAMIVALVRNAGGPDAIFVAGLAVLTCIGVFADRLPSPAEAVAGFGNPGAVTVGVLFVVAAGLTQTGAMQAIAAPLLGRPRTVARAQARLMAPIGVMSAFLNNTPIVAMFMPVISDWAKKSGFAPSKLFIPLSYAAILGGMCTLIGTSTNLVVNGLLITELGPEAGMGLFEIGAIGLPCALIGVGYILLVGRWLLPSVQPAVSRESDPRQYTVEMLVEPVSPLVGQSIEQAGLRHLPGLYLAEIERGEDVIAAVAPTERLAAGDRLVFVGVVDSVVDLRKMRGLTPATTQVFKLDGDQRHRFLVEAVVSNTCPLVGRSVREGRFRSRYNAAVIAAARNGRRIEKKIGDIVLEPGDTLLLEAPPSFVEQRRNSRDFFLVSPVPGSTPPRHERAPWAVAILAALVLAVSVGGVPMLAAVLAAGVLMIALGCCTATEARESVDWSVLLVIASALGIGRCVQTSGLAEAVASGIMGLGVGGPILALLAVYLLTNVFTELMTNNAAAVLVFPIARAVAESLGVSVMPFTAVIMIAASASFATPIGYQTNLMVFGPGGYRYSDYLRIGLPLNLLIMVVAVALAPLVWPF